MAGGFRLVMDQGPQAGRVFPLDRDVITLGRDPGNTIVINEPQVSRQHARITRRGGVLVLEDLGSTNGTFVNGMRLAGPHALSNGDVIGLSDAVTLTFSGSGMPAGPEAMPGQPAAPGAPAYAPAPQMAPGYGAPMYEVAQPAPPPFEQFEPEPARPSSRKWIFLGCGCLVLLVIAACLGVFVLDYLRLLPSIFYEPLRWLGFF
jgi:hypothetical protein